MATYSRRNAAVAFGKQGSEGVAQTTPKFQIPMESGFAGPERSVENLPWTNDSQDMVGAYVSRNAGAFSFTLPVLPVSSVGLLEAVLGSRNTSGSGPYTHALTPSDTLPFETIFYKQPGGNYWQLTDAKVGNAELGWSPGSPLSLSIDGSAKTVARSGSTWTTPTLTEGVDPFFTFVGATVKIDAAATPAATTVHNVGAGSISIARNLDPIQTDAITDQFVVEGNREISISLSDVVLEDNDFINAVYTGTTSGTALSGSVIYGSASFTFLDSQGTSAATRSLVIALPNVHWTIDQIPEGSGGGQTATYSVTGRAYKPSSGASITATVINGSSAAAY